MQWPRQYGLYNLLGTKMEIKSGVVVNNRLAENGWDKRLHGPLEVRVSEKHKKYSL